MSITPIFVLSLPRSGSTFVQRVLTAHEGVASAAEPWVLLPLLAPRQPGMPMSDPWQVSVAAAMGEFLEGTPDGPGAYERGVRALALDLYERAAGPGNRFFVDKTPPYHLIIDPLAQTFPDGRLVFLWRNPLSVVSSIIETLGTGRWETYQFRTDLFRGVDNLVRGYQAHSDRAHAVRYEDLVASEDGWRALAEYCGFDFDPEALRRFADVRLEGSLGDPTGVVNYQAISREPLQKWRKTIANPVRREWARRYLRWIGHERLEVMGYRLDDLLAELDAAPTTSDNVGADLAQLGTAALKEIAHHRLDGRRMPSTWRALLKR
jgi:hypothetical protein